MPHLGGEGGGGLGGGGDSLYLARTGRVSAKVQGARA